MRKWHGGLVLSNKSSNKGGSGSSEREPAHFELGDSRAFQLLSAFCHPTSVPFTYGPL
jgi:hypothetical protein